MNELVVFLQGVAATGAWIGGLFFLRFWRTERDALFALFAAAFWLLALSWTLISLLGAAEETRPYLYGIRLLAFALIIAGMIVKNRPSD
jgi:hypothetical protein